MDFLSTNVGLGIRDESGKDIFEDLGSKVVSEEEGGVPESQVIACTESLQDFIAEYNQKEDLTDEENAWIDSINAAQESGVACQMIMLMDFADTVGRSDVGDCAAALFSLLSDQSCDIYESGQGVVVESSDPWYNHWSVRVGGVVLIGVGGWFLYSKVKG